MSNVKTIIFFKQSFIECLIRAILTCLMLGAFFYFNYHFIGGSYFVNFLILIVVMCNINAAMRNKTEFVKIYEVSEETINKVQEIIN